MMAPPLRSRQGHHKVHDGHVLAPLSCLKTSSTRLTPPQDGGGDYVPWYDSMILLLRHRGPEEEDRG